MNEILSLLIAAQVSVYLLEYKSPNGAASTTETFTDYDSCNTKAKNLEGQGYEISRWCIQT
jgi:hypothetical protein